METLARLSMTKWTAFDIACRASVQHDGPASAVKNARYIFNYFSSILEASTDFCTTVPSENTITLPEGCLYNGKNTVDRGYCESLPCHSDDTNTHACNEQIRYLVAPITGVSYKLKLETGLGSASRNNYLGFEFCKAKNWIGSKEKICLLRR